MKYTAKLYRPFRGGEGARVPGWVLVSEQERGSGDDLRRVLSFTECEKLLPDGYKLIIFAKKEE